MWLMDQSVTNYTNYVIVLQPNAPYCIRTLVLNKNNQTVRVHDFSLLGQRLDKLLRFGGIELEIIVWSSFLGEGINLFYQTVLFHHAFVHE